MHRLFVVLVALAIAALTAGLPGPGHAAPHGGHEHAAPAHTQAEAGPHAAMACDDCDMDACPMTDCLQEALPPELAASGEAAPSPERSAILCRSCGVETEVLVPPPRCAASPALI